MQRLSGKILVAIALGLRSNIASFEVSFSFSISLQIRVPGDPKIQKDEQIGIEINLDKIHLFDSETEQAIFYITVAQNQG